MKIALDTADPENISHALEVLESHGATLDHITTNPNLVSKACQDYRKSPQDLLNEILNFGIETSIETLNGTQNYDWKTEDINRCVEEAMAIASLGKNVVVKIAATSKGIQAIRAIYPGIRSNATLGFDPRQGRLAARAGACYYSIFIGRMIANNFDGFGSLEKTVKDFENGAYPTQVLAASIRNFEQLERAYEAGAHIATISWEAFQEAERAGKIGRLAEMQKFDKAYHPRSPVDVTKLPLELEEDAFKHPLLAAGGQDFLNKAMAVGYNPLQLKASGIQKRPEITA